VTAVKATKRKKLVLASLWTEMCLAMPAIQAQGEGFEVYIVTDASGESRRKRMIWRSAEWFRLALCLSPGWVF
jgi:nicotinamidase-related amidase